MLVVTRYAREHGLPLKSETLVTEGKGQVIKLGKTEVQRILADYGITRVLAEEGGRTSRGSLGNMQKYVAFLNELNQKGLADMASIEKWWIERVKKHFSAKGFILHYDPSKSLKFIVEDILEQAGKRQKTGQGTMYTGAVLQHMVGAKLSLVLSEQKIEHRGYSVADDPSNGVGDFEIDDVVIQKNMISRFLLMVLSYENLYSFRQIQL